MNTDGDDFPDPEIGIWGWQDMPVGDFGQSKISERSMKKLNDFIDQLDKDHKINNGSTALWHHLVSIVSKSIEE